MKINEYDSLRFEKYHDLEFALAIDDETYAPILVIKYPDESLEEYKINATDIQSKGKSNFVEALIDTVSAKKIRKIKLDKLNEMT